MNHFDLSWVRVFEALPLWERVPFEARRSFLKHVKPSEPARKPDLGEAFPLLEELGFFQPSEGRIRATLKPQFKVFVRVVRAMGRSQVYDSPTTVAFNAYLKDNFTLEERAAVGVAGGQRQRSYYGSYYREQDIYRRTASSQWVQTFVASSWVSWHDKQVSRQRPIPGPEVHSEAQELVRFLIERAEPVTLKDLCAAWDDRDPSRLPEAFVHGLRQLLVFPALRDGDLEPIVGIWPSAALRLSAAPPKPATVPKAGEVFQAPFLVDDMASIVVVCASEPLRLRGNDWRLFVKAEREIASQLAPLPEWLEEPFSLGPAARTDTALRLLAHTGRVVQAGVAGRDLRFEVTKKGRDWLSLGPKERLQELLNQIKESIKEEVSSKGSSKKNTARKRTPLRVIPRYAEDFDDDYGEDDDDYGYDSYDPYYHDDYTPASPLNLLPYTLGAGHQELSNAELTEAVRQRCADLPSEGFVDAAVLLEFEARGEHPFRRLLALGSYLSFYLGPISLYSPSEGDLDIAWSRLLSDTFFQRLLPLGAVKVGMGEGGAISLGLSEVGRYLFDLTPEFSIDLPDHQADRSVVVQPNFDVVFLAPSPATEVVISRFAERRGRRVGVLFHITKQSIFIAASAGLTAEVVIENLRGVCSNELPANVEREIRGWSAQCRRIEMQPSIVIRCPDEDTAARVRSVGKGKVRAISETVLEFSEPKQKTQFVRKLRGMGIFV